jgi:hypothetical protein
MARGVYGVFNAAITMKTSKCHVPLGVGCAAVKKWQYALTLS